MGDEAEVVCCSDPHQRSRTDESRQNNLYNRGGGWYHRSRLPRHRLRALLLQGGSGKGIAPSMYGSTRIKTDNHETAHVTTESTSTA